MFSSKTYLLGRAYSLIIGGIIFIVGSILLPIFNSEFRTTEILFVSILVGPLMVIGGLLFYYVYKKEEKEALRLHQQNEQLKKEIQTLKNGKDNTFRFDDIDK